MTTKLFFNRDSEGRVSLEQFRKVKHEWNLIAGEQLRFDLVTTNLYAYGSELATLRLLKAFRNNEYAYQGFSKNLSTHYLCMEVDLEYHL